MRALKSSFFLTFFLFGISWSLPGLSEDVDPRVAQNPILVELGKVDRDLLDDVMLEIDRILAQPSKQTTRSLSKDPPNNTPVIQENPLFGEIYKEDPKATLKLIRVIQSKIK